MDRRPLAVEEDRRRMSGRRPDSFTGSRIYLDADDGCKCFGFLGCDETAQFGDRLRWAEGVEQMGAQGVSHLGHQGGRLKTVTRSITDDQCDVA